MRQASQVDNEQPVGGVVCRDVGVGIETSFARIPELVDLDVTPCRALAVDEPHLSGVLWVRHVVDRGPGAVSHDCVFAVGVEVEKTPDIGAAGRR